MGSIFVDLITWSKSLPRWEQYTFGKILRGEDFIDADYERLADLILIENGLLQTSGDDLDIQELSVPEDRCVNQIKLLQLSNLQNINALVPNQVMVFGDNLTAIYGGTGSGKSGFARVLGRAGFTRGDKDILPNVMQSIDDNVSQSVDMQILDQGQLKEIHYDIKDGVPPLPGFYVFDTACVNIHLTKTNSLSFSPFGLSCLTELVDVLDTVSSKLNVRVEAIQKPVEQLCLFQGVTEISKAIQEIDTNPNTKTLKELATLDGKEKDEITKLEKEIGQLKSFDLASELKSLEQSKDDILSLITSVKLADAKLNNQSLDEVNNLINQMNGFADLAKSGSIRQFKSEGFKHVGSDVWFRFIEAAKELADLEGKASESYPKDGDACLLCRQPLGDPSRNFVSGLFTLLQGKAQVKYKEARKRLALKVGEIQKLNLDFFQDQTAVSRFIKSSYPQIFNELSNYAAVLGQRKILIERVSNDNKVIKVKLSLASVIPHLENLVADMEQKIQQLGKDDHAEKIQKLSERLALLNHKILLNSHVSIIGNYVEQKAWAKKVGDINLSTRHITTKYEALFNQLVTDRYLSMFKQYLIQLNYPHDVIVTAKPSKGEMVKQIVLNVRSGTLANSVTIDRVLSEGERRAVALADFLTEMNLDDKSHGVIFDDPVTSLDKDWKEEIAKVLAQEAKTRQVIIFTHDLSFLYYLNKYADNIGVGVRNHWVCRGVNDGKPGYVYCDNSPSLEQEYRNTSKALECYRQAKASSITPQEQERLLKEGFAALRTTYEVFIIHNVFCDVVQRFEERVSIDRLKEVVFDRSLLDAVMEKIGLLSRYIEGHSHTDGHVRKLTPELLIKEIQEYDQIKASHDALKKGKSETQQVFTITAKKTIAQS